MPKKKPTHQQAKFIEAMANPKTKNHTQAAIMAGCPPKNARITASKWLTNSNISEAIESRKRRALAHHRITPEEVIGSAVFQMRSSIDDLLGKEGSFSIEKARETGVIDLVKKLEIKTVEDMKTGNKETIYKIEMLSNQDGRKEVANYIGIENFKNRKPITDEEMFMEIFRRVVIKGGISPAEAIAGLKRVERFKNFDVSNLNLLID